MIQVEGLTKYYGAAAAIKDLTFSIDKGEVIGFLGLNGAGKTTTLRVLGCVLLPTSGKVTIDGFDVVSNPHEIRKRIGFLPDSPPLYNEMTVSRYLDFVARLRGLSAQDAARRVPEVEAQTGLTEVHDAPISSLSHGYRQRVGLAQAVVHKPKLLILDEPTSGLDPVQIVEMRQLIRSLKGDHTVLLSSHNLTEISQTCDRLLVIQDGLIIAQGTEADLAARSVPQLTGQAAEAPGTSGSFVVDIVDAGEGASFDKATDVLQKIVGVRRVSLVQKERGLATLRVDAPAALRPQAVRALVLAEVDIMRVDAGQQLEETFLKLTKPGSN